MENFWDFKSKNYPTAMEEHGLVTPNRVLTKVREFGIDFKFKSVLDIGCGTGLYSSIISKEAQNILGVDISTGMLSKFKEYIKLNGVKNIELKKSDFKQFNANEQYDIVLCAMTPAISSLDDLDVMMGLAKESCIYVSFSKNRHSPIMDEVLTKLGYPNKIKNKFFETKEYINSLGYETKEEFFEHNWSQEGTLEEIANDVLEHLRLKDVNIELSKIKELLKPFENDGKIVRETFSTIGVLVWNKD